MPGPTDHRESVQVVRLELERVVRVGHRHRRRFNPSDLPILSCSSISCPPNVLRFSRGGHLLAFHTDAGRRRLQTLVRRLVDTNQCST